MFVLINIMSLVLLIEEIVLKPEYSFKRFNHKITHFSCKYSYSDSD